jgi:hypothetical protein
MRCDDKPKIADNQDFECTRHSEFLIDGLGFIGELVLKYALDAILERG